MTNEEAKVFLDNSRGKGQTMSDCEVCIYELIGHQFGKMIHKTCRENTRCPFYKPKEAKGEASDERTA